VIRFAILVSLVLLAGCSAPLEKGDAPLLLVPVDPSTRKIKDEKHDSKLDLKVEEKGDNLSVGVGYRGAISLLEDEKIAFAAFKARRYDDAADVYYRLSQGVTNVDLRAEFLLYAAEASLGDGEHYPAYQHYSRLIKLYSDTPHYDHAVARLFLLARLFAQGKARKPSWLLALPLTDLEFGIQALERFQRARERHPSSDDALHYAAEAYLESGDPGLAVDTWTRLGRTYPDSEWAETAEYRTGLATLALSDGPRYDKGPMISGLKRLEAYLRDHPRGNHAKQARAKTKELRELLSTQLLIVARYYQRKDQDYSARLYLTAIQRDYPKTPAAREAATLANSIPKTSPPPAPPPPEELEGAKALDADRLRIAPAPVDDNW
jgi:hypothetical protein